VKKIALLLAASLILTGCSQGSGAPEGSESETSDQIQVDEGLLTVDITVPASFLSMGGEEFTQAKVDEAVSSEGYLSGKLNDDGSVSYSMTKIKHAEMINGVKSSFDESIEDSLAEYPNVTAVTRNNDFTEIRIETTENDFSLGFLGLGLSFQAYFFHILNGSEYKLDVVIVDSDTGEELDRTTYPVEG
jgi:hypothetical protein